MSKLKDMWDRLQERLAEDRKAQKAYKELSRLTDKELHDIGIARGEIWRVIHSVKESSHA